MKKYFSIIVFVSIILFAGSLFANNAGVGLGTLIFQGKQGKFFELLAVTTNGFSGTSTFAITSGTSGYKEGSTVGMTLVKQYVAQNMDNLASDIAKGEGEYVETLAHLMKVNDRANFKLTLKNNFNKIYTSESITSEEVVNNIVNVYKV